MKAWQVDEITEAGTMRMVDLPEPRPGPGEYRIAVATAGLNFLDTLMVRGRYQRKPPLPFIPGVEVAGTVLEAGPGAPLGVGQRISGWIETGGFAEQAIVPVADAVALPDAMPFADALSLLGVNYPKSYQGLLHRAALQPGETVLVHAGAGGVGSAAIQIARGHGCRVIATAGSPAKLDTCRQLGADEALSYADPGWVDAVRRLTGGEGADVIYDPVGGAVGENSLRCLAWMGRYLIVGFAAGGIPALAANRLLLKSASALGVVWGAMRTRDPALAQRVYTELMALYELGTLAPLIGARYPLSEAPAALAALAGRSTTGKIVLET